MSTLTNSQKKRIAMIQEEGYSVQVRFLSDESRKISAVVKKDFGSVFNDEHYHLFIGPKGAVTGVSSGNFQAAKNVEEHKKHEAVLLSLLFYKCFGNQRRCTIKII